MSDDEDVDISDGDVFDSDEEFDDISDDDDNGVNEDSCGDEAPTSSTQECDFEYTIVSPEEIEQEKNKLIGDVDKVLEVGNKQAGLLLQKCQWDKESLTELYYNDREALFKSCGVIEAHRKDSSPSLKRPRFDL